LLPMSNRSWLLPAPPQGRVQTLNQPQAGGCVGRSHTDVPGRLRHSQPGYANCSGLVRQRPGRNPAVRPPRRHVRPRLG
jgi:hypothetical protein